MRPQECDAPLIPVHGGKSDRPEVGRNSRTIASSFDATAFGPEGRLLL
jgi:hypothetical protein